MSSHAATAVELMKLLRGMSLSVNEIASEMQMNAATVRNWMSEMAANGLVDERPGPHRDGPGVPAKVYALRREWGGEA